MISFCPSIPAAQPKPSGDGAPRRPAAAYRRAAAALGAPNGESDAVSGFPLPCARTGSAPIGVPKPSWIVRSEVLHCCMDIYNHIPRNFLKVPCIRRMEVATANKKPLHSVTSLLVQNVQSLAASESLKDIPERYVRPEIDAYPRCDGANQEEVPVVDMYKLLNPQYSLSEAAKLILACEDWGFFQLINHGVSDTVTEEIKKDIEEFFLLPSDEKMAVAKPPDSIEGYGQHFVLSEDQKLDWGDMFFLFTQPVTHRNMRFWPTHPHTFGDTLDAYSVELKRVRDCLLGLIGRDLGLVPEKFTDLFKEGSQAVRINYYPPCPHPDKVLGLSPHPDSVGLTLLLQVNEVQGLQIKRNGRWISIKPLPGAFVVNIGDILEIMSNGKYKSIEHRAIINTEKERLSIAAFHNPTFDTMIGPIPELVERNMAHYKTLSPESYIKLINSSKLDGKRFLDQMKL